MRPLPILMTLLALTSLACAQGPDSKAPSSTSTSTSTATSSLPAGDSDPPFLLGGIQVNEADHQAWFDALLEQGMNTVQVTDYAMQGDWDTDHMWWDQEEPWVLEEIRGAKKRGLEVVLVLRVALDHAFERNAFLWHGMIMPKTPELLDSWFEQYTRFCRKWAEIAEREGVDVLMIGSEMNALASTLPLEEPPALEEYFLNEEKQERRRREVLERRELIEDTQLSLRDKETFETVDDYIDARIATEQAWAQSVAGGADSQAGPEAIPLEELNARRARLQEKWQGLIAVLRQVYSGPLGYAANFDQYHEVGFWPELDVIGINAYFKLRHQVLDGFDPERLYPLLEEGWRDVLGRIETFRREQGLEEKPVIFTELGYTWRRESTLEPWADTGFSVIEEPTPSPGGEEGEPIRHVVVWREQPKQLEERALAVRALFEAHRALDEPFLRGLLYWKLSSHDYHEDDESFMIHVGPGTVDPALPELRRFVEAAARDYPAPPLEP